MVLRIKRAGEGAQNRHRVPRRCSDGDVDEVRECLEQVTAHSNATVVTLLPWVPDVKQTEAPPHLEVGRMGLVV
jgi:hypothetical protein